MDMDSSSAVETGGHNKFVLLKNVQNTVFDIGRKILLFTVNT